MVKPTGSGRAHICYPEKHTAGVLSGGKLPQINNPHYEVADQMEPTTSHPIRRRQKHAQGHLKGGVK